MLIVSLVLVYGVILVNGWTDAPNSVATAISSGAIKYKKAVILCGIFNFLGVFLGCLIDTSVAKFVFSVGVNSNYATTVVCISLFTMIAFGSISSILGLPSSESHAMISSMVGASFFLSKDVNFLKTMGKVFVFTVFSCILALIVSYFTRMIFKYKLPYKKLEYLSSSLSATMHGYQSGLKFLGVIAYLLNVDLSGNVSVFPLCLSIGFTLGLGALLGGKKIMSTMGDNIVKITHISSFSSDIATYISLLVCSLLGMPVSTGNVKCLSIIGVGIYEKQKINKKTTTKLLISFIIVFPICFLVGYYLMKLFINFWISFKYLAIGIWNIAHFFICDWMQKPYTVWM